MLSYSEKFVAIRRKLRLSQDALAQELGVSGSAIGLIEQGKTKNPGADLLAALASKLGVSLEWLLLGHGEMFGAVARHTIHASDDAEVAPKRSPFLANRIVIDTGISDNKRDSVSEGPEPQKDILPLLDELSEMIYLFRYNEGDRRNIIREYYQIIEPEIFKLASHGSNAHKYMWHWNFDRDRTAPNPNAGRAWAIIKNIPIGMYPSYPVLDYTLDFGDPYRQIAVFIEEATERWDYTTINAQDKVLSLYGWKVFRVPLAVAKTSEADILPSHLLDVYYEQPEDDLLLQERKKWDIELSKKTVDGFFYWLKSIYFKDEFLTSISAKERGINGWYEGRVRYHFDNTNDILDKIVFGITSSEWKLYRSGKKGDKSIRDTASTNQAIVLASLEGVNSILRKKIINNEDSLRILAEHAHAEFALLGDDSNKNRLRAMLNDIKNAIIDWPF